MKPPYVQVHDDPGIFRNSIVDWRKQIEEEARRQIWPDQSLRFRIWLMWED